MNFLFAWRYFKSKKSTNAINIIAWISVLAITVGTAALIIVLSVFNGFEGLVKQLYSNFYADLKITPSSGKFFTLSDSQKQEIVSTPGIAYLSFVAEEKAVFTNNDYQTIVYLKGVDDNFSHVNRIDTTVVRGSYNVGTASDPRLVVGIGIESAGGLNVTSILNSQGTIYLPNRNAKNLASEEGMHSADLFVSGAFTIQQDFDNKYAFTNLAFMQYMLDLSPNEYSAVEFKVNNVQNINNIKKILSQKLGSSFIVETRDEQNRSLFAIMQMEKWIIYGILSLILVVAAFNMIGALTMLVLEKHKDVAILRALGANNNLIQRIFLSEGIVIAAVGGVSGMLLAYLICFLQIRFKLIKLQGAFVTDYYPVKLLPQDFVLVTCTVCFIAIFAAWLPAKKAAKQVFSLKS